MFTQPIISVNYVLLFLLLQSRVSKLLQSLVNSPHKLFNFSTHERSSLRVWAFRWGAPERGA